MATTRRVICLVTSLLVIMSTQTQAVPDVSLSTGIARGQNEISSENGAPYMAYYGIPFAEPPVGELRFQPPRRYAGRGDQNTVLTFNTFRETCFQQNVRPSMIMSEDCLHLNIFTPADVNTNNGTTGLKNVMVWIHGGGYVVGDAAPYVPSVMVTDHDVIVVTLQYRLAALGFLSSQDEAMPGNLGLMDQILALEWVKENIRLFGGNPDDVTIFGQSAGSGSVSCLSISPKSKGLFTKSIMQSGTIFSPWSLIPNARDTFYRLANNSNCLLATYDPLDKLTYHKNIVNCLKTKSAKELIDATPVADPPLFESKVLQSLPRLAPVIDGDVIPRDPEYLMTDTAYLKKIGALDRKYILGVTDSEGNLFMRKGGNGMFTDPSSVSQLIQSTVEYNLGTSAYSPSALDVVDFVYGYPRDSNGKISPQGMVNLQTDNQYAVPMMKFARALSAASPSTPIYIYQFDAELKLKDPNGPLSGTSHAMELNHEFDPSHMQETVDFLYVYADLDPVNYPLVAGNYRSYITSFVKTGIPTTKGSTTAAPLYSADSERYLAISSDPKVRSGLFAQRMSLWLDFLSKTVERFPPKKTDVRAAYREELCGDIDGY